MKTRRDFMHKAALIGAAVTGQEAYAYQMPINQTGMVPRRKLGNTDMEVSILGVGGFHVGSAKTLEEAKQIVNQALDAGINFFDNAWEYHQGKSEE